VQSGCVNQSAVNRWFCECQIFPVLSLGIPNQHASTDSLFSFTIPNDAFSDRNNDKLTYTAEAVPVYSMAVMLAFILRPETFRVYQIQHQQ
jgi:hypothetical protein